MSSDWWKTFFTGVAVDFWLRAAPDERSGPEVNFVVRRLGVMPPARLLDVPCGGGRHSVALARRGYRMTGVDLSADFLTAARAKAEDLSVAWHERDMRDLPWTAEFDGAICLGNSFGYLDDAGNADFLHAVGRALKPGARFVLNSGIVAESILPNLKERLWYDLDGILFLIRNHHDLAQSRLESELTFVWNGKVERHSISQRVYTYKELAGLLEAAGLADLHAFGTLEGEAYRLGSQQVYLTATRT